MLWELLGVRRLLCSLEFPRLYGEVLLSSPWKVPYDKGIYKFPCWLTGIPGTQLWFTFSHQLSNTMSCAALQWHGRGVGQHVCHMEEETSSVCHLHTAPSSPLQAAAGQELEWKELALV